MIARPSYPADQDTRKQAIRAALVVNKCLAESNRFAVANNHRRAKEKIDGAVGYLVSGSIALEHLAWALNELRCHTNGGYA